jgi:hypothetical protein
MYALAERFGKVQEIYLACEPEQRGLSCQKGTFGGKGSHKKKGLIADLEEYVNHNDKVSFRE